MHAKVNEQTKEGEERDLYPWQHKQRIYSCYNSTDTNPIKIEHNQSSQDSSKQLPFLEKLTCQPSL